jgi:hypothetical protein
MLHVKQSCMSLYPTLQIRTACPYECTGNVLTVLVKNPLMTTREVVRGYTGTYTCPKEDEYERGRLLPIHHVIFVLHGIGEAVWSRSTCCKCH